MHQVDVAEFLQSIGLEVRSTDGVMFFHTTASDGMTAYHPLASPHDIDKGTMRWIRNRLPPELFRIRREDVFEALRSIAVVEEPTPMPWESVSIDESGGSLRLKDAHAGFYSVVLGSGRSLPWELAGAVYDRHRSEVGRPRVPVFVIIAGNGSRPSVMAMLDTLLGGRVHVPGVGHGAMPPGTLAIVYDSPPGASEPPDFWHAMNGDIEQVPVIVSTPQEWSAWEGWFNLHTSRPGVMPSHYAYVAGAIQQVPYTSESASLLWSGVLTFKSCQIGASKPPGRSKKNTTALLEKVERMLQRESRSDPLPEGKEDTPPGSSPPPAPPIASDSALSDG